MNKHIILSIALLCTISRAQDTVAETAVPAANDAVVAPEKPADAPVQSVAESNPAPAQPATPAKPKPRPKPPANSFYRFVRIFLMLLSNDQIQNNVKMIEKLFVSLIQTGYQIIQTAKPAALAPKRSDLDHITFAHLTDELLKEMKAVTINQNQPQNSQGKMDEPTKEILANFAGVVQNFFTILQDPENPQTVPASIIGMLAGMVNIGTIAMTKGNLPVDADYEQLKRYAQELDIETKQDMYRIILSTKHRAGISIA